MCLLKSAVLLTAFSSGCLYVSADVASIEQKLDDQKFPGAGPAAGTRVKVSHEFVMNIGDSLDGLASTAALTRMTFTPTSGVSKMDFIFGLTVTAKGDGTVPDAVIATFSQGMALASNGAIDAKVTDVDLAPYFKKSLMFELAVDVAAPAPDWSLGVEAEYRASTDEKIQP